KQAGAEKHQNWCLTFLRQRSTPPRGDRRFESRSLQRRVRCEECLVGERAVAHGGPGIEKLCDWLIARTGATPEVIWVAIEMTQGPVVEALLERGFCVYGINPK